MLRLDDILSEVRRQIRYLERQVDKARRYKKVQEDLVEVEKKVASLEFWTLQSKSEALSSAMNEFQVSQDIFLYV